MSVQLAKPASFCRFGNRHNRHGGRSTGRGRGIGQLSRHLTRHNRRHNRRLNCRHNHRQNSLANNRINDNINDSEPTDWLLPRRHLPANSRVPLPVSKVVAVAEGTRSNGLCASLEWPCPHPTRLRRPSGGHKAVWRENLKLSLGIARL